MHRPTFMRWFLAVGMASLVLGGCGGSTSIDPASGGAAGSGASAGTGGAGAVGGGGSGNVGGGGTGNVGGGGSGNVGGGGTGNGGGTGGSSYCCASDSDCPTYYEGADGPGIASECINGVCKDVPAAGSCWSDKDCAGLPGACLGGSVCPCEMDCAGPDTLGKCTKPAGCCVTDQDCAQKPNFPLTCVAGNCEPVPPSGQCWTDKECNGGACGGACVCPCGMVCACGGQMGWCTSFPPPPPYCCSTHAECGPGAVCANSVCKKSEAPYCWADVECPAGTKCVGANICPCLALCAIADNPGKCQ